MSTDPFAGMGGSYIQHPDGTRELIERTGLIQPEQTPETAKLETKPSAKQAPASDIPT